MSDEIISNRKLILGTAGHIDHGKTALVRALTGTDTDRLPQEKQRGITIDIGFAELDLGDFDLGVVDVPGHERFIKNMLAGASGIDLALLVVAADDSVMPQTREHLAILQLLNVKHGLIALTKTDLADPDWVELVADDVATLVEGTFLEGAPIVRTSATTGAGIDELKATLTKVCAQVQREDAGRLFRMAVDRSFTVQGLGTVITGSVWQGNLDVESEIAWLPSGKKVRVRGIQTHGRSVETATRGQRAAVNLSGVHHQEIERGHEIATPGFLKPARTLTAKLHVLKDSPWPIKHRQRLRLYLGTQEIMATVALLQGTAIQPGQAAPAQLNCALPTVATGGQPFVLRAESPLVTIGGGHILQPVASHIARKDEDAITRLEALASGDETERAKTTIFFYGVEPWTELDLCRDANLTAAAVEKTISQFLTDRLLVKFTLSHQRQARLHRDVVERLSTHVERALEKMHQQSPLATAFPREQLTEQVRYLCENVLLERLVDHMMKAGRITGTAKAVALPGHAPKLTKTQKAMQAELKDTYRAAGSSPPTAAELAKKYNTTEPNLRPILDLCVVEGELVHLDSGMYLHTEAEAALRNKLADALRDSEGLTTSEIRVLLDSTRKYVIPICEHLDRTGFTKRIGDKRVLVGGATNHD